MSSWTIEKIKLYKRIYNFIDSSRVLQRNHGMYNGWFYTKSYNIIWFGGSFAAMAATIVAAIEPAIIKKHSVVTAEAGANQTTTIILLFDLD